MLNTRMVISDIRLGNYRYLLDLRFGGHVVDMANACGKQASAFSRFTASHNQRRNIGPSNARLIEAVCKKPRGWLDVVHQECEIYYTESVKKNGTLKPDIRSAVPLLRFEQVSEWLNDEASVTVDETLIQGVECHDQNSRQFAIKLENDSMTPDFPMGTIVFAEECNSARPGQYVVAVDPAGHVQFKQFVEDAGEFFIKPANPQYPTKRFSEGWSILGVLAETRRFFPR